MVVARQPLGEFNLLAGEERLRIDDLTYRLEPAVAAISTDMPDNPDAFLVPKRGHDAATDLGCAGKPFRNFIRERPRWPVGEEDVYYHELKYKKKGGGNPPPSRSIFESIDSVASQLFGLFLSHFRFLRVAESEI